ncbi:YibE/F family protein [Actinomycetaceae bacterium TAE3-ERU4]|nr:YibE/F family protein [Actinomycetaceae bacterium TAE3-ERU4]
MGQEEVSHLHNHSAPIRLEARTQKRVRALLAAVVLPLVALTLVGLIFLWPGKVALIGSQRQLVANSTEVLAEVTDLSPVSCLSLVGGVSDAQEVCATLLETREIVSVHVPPEIRQGLRVGDKLRVLRTSGAVSNQGAEGSTGLPSKVYIYLDMYRTFPLAILALIYVLVVVAVAWHKGILALAGLALSVTVIVFFVVPALMSGSSPLLVTLVGVSAMILASVYVAHGISIKTTTALLGTYFGLVVTTLAAFTATRWLHLTGTGEEIASVHNYFPTISLASLVTCGMVIAGLGALNDVTITQASTVWELYETNPARSRWAIFSSAMRVGRDHIASTVYTLSFAYAGTALPMLMLVMLVNRSGIDLVTSGQISEEIVRTLIASMGLVLAIPVTTGIGVLLLPHKREQEENNVVRSRSIRRKNG